MSLKDRRGRRSLKREFLGLLNSLLEATTNKEGGKKKLSSENFWIFHTRLSLTYWFRKIGSRLGE